ncbi:hypothetical protein ASU35_04840 [Acetivibrio ethanolgignens]|uniref:Pyruvate carboxyltransferase domain-containing protein n=1 Tax=Acetivibrio ethanolgignens TaxID=290052 RepID=A0A0V8QB81_9FIRM|nr:hypothetical protein ASU35_04840 [Acetivibrio ethanolgignens]
MKNIQLLDCTLRDGGYVNDWKFGQINLISMFERLVDANIDIIEVGFLDERRPFDKDRSIMPNTEAVQQIFGNLDKKHSMIVGMIDYGTCNIDNLQPCEESYLDGIRVIFKKHLMKEAMEFCKNVKALGYKVFSQLVSITSYSDEELLSLISLVNDVKPYAVSMVDTYGLLYPEDLFHYYNILEKNVLPDIRIGFHAHNNFQLAYANSLEFIGKESKHDIVVDGTMFGMGKSAGNAPIELVGMRLNEKYGKDYQIDSILQGIEESVMDFYYSSPWGYKEFFYLCAKNQCHPNYITYFQSKQNLSTKKIDEILSLIEPEEKKLLYDKHIAEALYEEYISNKHIDDKQIIQLKKEINSKVILLIGPGKNIKLQESLVQKFIKERNPYIISINYIPDNIEVNCVFISNPKRYHEMILKLHKVKVTKLATTNVECINGSFDYIVNRAPLLENDEKIIDNSFLMLINLMKRMNVNALFCAGLDGYSEMEDNYCNPGMEYSFMKQEAAYLNRHMKNKVNEYRKYIDISFITFSAYDMNDDINSAFI